MLRTTFFLLALTAALHAETQVFEAFKGDGFNDWQIQSTDSVAGLVSTSVIPGVQIPEGSVLKIEADYEHQKLCSPTAITFDEQGRVYVAETHRFAHGVEDDRKHLAWYLDDLASKKVSDRKTLIDKWTSEVSHKFMTEKSEIIRRLADTTGDGNLNDNQVFADGFNNELDGTGSGVFAFDGSIYYACIPKIYMLKETGDIGQTDVRKVVQDGFGVRFSLSGHDLNGFVLGPDGRIYGTCGDRGLNGTTTEGVDYDYRDKGFAFSFEPDGTDFRIFHTGLRNPKEIAFDALGNPFSVDNNADQGDAARIVYLVEGGDSGWEMEHQAMFTFHRQIGLEKKPLSRWMDEKMWELQNPVQPAYILPPAAYLTTGPAGLTYNPGAGFTESEKNHFLVSDYRGGAATSGVWSFEMKPKDAGMEMTEFHKFVSGVAATDVEYSWDGRVFISDFVGGWESQEAGRLLSLDAGPHKWRAADCASAAKIVREGFGHRSSEELFGLLRHPDARVRLRAQIALTRKPDAFKRFSDGTASPDFMVRIHSIWGLGILARRGSSPLPFVPSTLKADPIMMAAAQDKLISLLADKDAEIRSQVLKVLADAKGSIKSIPAIPLLADASARVRFFAAILIGRRKIPGCFDSICALLRENDNRDVYLRHACIDALQHTTPDSAAIAALGRDSSAALRLAAVVVLRRMESPDVASFVNDADPKVADEAIRAVCDTDMNSQRPIVAKLLDHLKKREWTPFMLHRLLHNSFRIGTAENAARILKFAADPKNPQSQREEALRLISIWIDPPPADQLTGHFNPLPKRDPQTLLPALAATLPQLLHEDGSILTSALGLVTQYHVSIASLDDKTLRSIITKRSLPPDARANAFKLLVDRKPSDLRDFLTTLSSDPADDVALTAISELTKLSPQAALPKLEAAIASGKPHFSQEAWKILATIPGNQVDQIFVTHLQRLSAVKGIAPDAIELIDSAKKRTAPAVVAAVSSLEKSLAQDPDPLAKWNIALRGGDPDSGAAIFTSEPASECMRCHRAEPGHSAAGDAAPNLAGVAKRHQDPHYFLESMIDPSAVIAPGYGTVVIDFKNGSNIAGNLLSQTSNYLDLDVVGKIYRIQRADISSVTNPVSPMPPMGKLLKPVQIRDLIAWLSTLTKGGNQPNLDVDPQPLDPKTLAIPQKSANSAGIDSAFLKTGRQQFLTCSACHGPDAKGTAIAPPLAGSEWINGPAENLIRIQLRGLQGPIQVNGQPYNFPVGMAALAYQTDDQIAAVLTYVRNSFGNSASPVTPAQVKALRSEEGKPQLNAADLILPK